MTWARAGVAAWALTALAAALPSAAHAHGIAERSDLPIPTWLFAWAAGLVLLVSFVALAVFWSTPKLEDEGWRELPGGLGRALASRPVEVAAGALGVALLAIVVWSGLAGEQVASANFAPTFVYVAFWVGLVPLSVLFGDVFRGLNPWRAIGRAAGFAAGRVARDALPSALSYPRWLGHWPAVAGLLLFTWLELASQDGELPRTVALFALAYTAVTLFAMTLFGVEPWIRHGEAFSVYFGLFARLAPVSARDGRVGVRRPMSGLAALRAEPGTVALLAVMIGTVTYDGASEGPLLLGAVPELARSVEAAGLSPARAIELAATVGLVVSVLLVLALYRVGVAGTHTAMDDGRRGRDLAGAFVHSLVPIALVYAAAHYLTLLAFQGQALIALASDPLGRGADLLGTARYAIDYGWLSPNLIWYLQVALVVLGHVAALALAHDRALVLAGDARVAARTQVPMLAVMVGFTGLALWLLAQSNA